MTSAEVAAGQEVASADLDGESLVATLNMRFDSAPASVAVPHSHNIPFPDQRPVKWPRYAAGLLLLVIGIEPPVLVPVASEEKPEEKITEVANSVRDLLVSKNRAYGDSALTTVAIFGNADPIISLTARIDDKLMRIKNRGINVDTEDTVSDLIGYLILLKIALNDANQK